MAKKATTSKAKKVSGEPARSACGNPIIGKGEGDAPVKAYIAAMPGWKKSLGQKLDKTICSVIPGIEKQVKWNTPFYGFQDSGWIVAFYCYKKYVQVTFFSGDKLRPQPPVASKQEGVRYLKIFEEDAFDETQFKKWIKQARKLPGEKL